MTSLLVALVLRALHLLHPGLESQGDAPDVARAIARAVVADSGRAPVTGSHAEDAVLLALYAAHESGLHVRPRGESWDARAGVSCGAWQMPCRLVAGLPLKRQAALWLTWARAGGLAALDSSPARADRRRRRARLLLAGVLP